MEMKFGHEGGIIDQINAYFEAQDIAFDELERRPDPCTPTRYEFLETDIGTYILVANSGLIDTDATSELVKLLSRDGEIFVSELEDAFMNWNDPEPVCYKDYKQGRFCPVRPADGGLYG